MTFQKDYIRTLTTTRSLTSWSKRSPSGTQTRFSKLPAIHSRPSSWQESTFTLGAPIWLATLALFSFNSEGKTWINLIFIISSESKLKREFEQYGTVKSIRMVMSTKDTKPRGYAFIEYEHEKDMHCKYPDLIRAVLYMVLIPNFESDRVLKQSCPSLSVFQSYG